MSSAECLREFVNERLTAAADEIFGVFRKTIVDLEEEIDRQRRLLEFAWKPEIKLHRIELPQQLVCKQEEVLCVQERSSSLEQEDPEPPQIKEEQEELCTGQEGEQLGLKQDTDALMLTHTNDESHHSGDQTMHQHQEETPHEPEKQSEVKMPVITSVVSESNKDRQLLSNDSHLVESPDQKEDEHGDSGSTVQTTSNPEPRPKRRCQGRKSHTKSEHKATTSKGQRKTTTANKPLKCDNCDKTFECKSHLIRHCRIHTGEKPYPCETCGVGFRLRSSLTVHVRKHTGEKPFVCKTCGKSFIYKQGLERHMRIHTGEKPFTCKTCGVGFRLHYSLTVHMRKEHSDEKLYLCKTCGKSLHTRALLNLHTRVHTGEKPYTCTTCERAFGYRTDLKVHIRRAHTGEKPYLCKICGKRFVNASDLARHRRCHTAK